METSSTNVVGLDPIDTSDSEESAMEEDPELADDLHNVVLDEREEDPELVGDLCNIILDNRGKEQPCPVGTAADPVMDPQAEVVASAPSPDTAALPKEEVLGEPPSSNPTETTQDLGAQDAVILLCEEDMTDFP